MYKKTYIGIVA